MKRMKKIIISICFCLLAAGAVCTGLPAEVHAARTAQETQSTTTVGYTAGGSELPSGTTSVSKGTPVAKTGDDMETGRAVILLAGSAVMILLVLLGKERRERKENRF